MSDSHRSLIVAHRGSSHGSPENSLESISELPAWVVAVEIDVRRTKDGVLMETSAMAPTCVIMVRTEKQLAAARGWAPDMRLGCFGVTSRNVERRIAAAASHGAELLMVRHGDQAYLDNREVVPRARAAGLLVGASTINSWHALDAAHADQCDLIITDKAEQLTPAHL